MTSIKVFVHRRAPEGESIPASARQLSIVGGSESRPQTACDGSDDDRTFAERVFMFLDQRSA